MDGNNSVVLVRKLCLLHRIIFSYKFHYIYRGVWGGGRKVGTIMTQGKSACSRQQVETPTGCSQYWHNLDGSIRDLLNRAASPVVRQIVAVLSSRSYSATLTMQGAPRSVISWLRRFRLNWYMAAI